MEKLLMKNEAKLVRFDWAIKYLLRDKANFDILEGFLSALLNEKIQIISILESESNQFDSEDKFNRVDILVKDQKQRQIIIEASVGWVERQRNPP
jgi:predicted transposase/invertase (TIGR01784 family)